MLLLALACTPSGSDPAGLQAALENARTEQDLPGLAAAVLHHDGELWVGATGWAEVDVVEWTPDHSSRMGSVTKTFTTALIHQLVAEGALSLDDTLDSHVPDTWSGVTVRHLLQMSSGIVSYNYVGGFDTTRPWTPDELVEWARQHEPALRFTPGSKWEYSNTNHILLAQIAEAVTATSYDTLLQQRFLGPLELDSMWMAGSDSPVPDDLVHSYDTSGADLGDFDPSFGWAAGSLVSTPADLARWNDALFHGDVLNEASWTAMTTPGEITSADQRTYGLGVFAEGDDVYTTWGHTGGIAGHLTYAYTMQEPAVTVVLMSNQLPTELDPAAGHIWAEILQ